MIPVKGHVGLYRDELSDAIINSNDREYNEYIKSKNKLIENEQKMSKIEEELAEIKNLLRFIVENK